MMSGDQIDGRAVGGLWCAVLGQARRDIRLGSPRTADEALRFFRDGRAAALLHDLGIADGVASQIVGDEISAYEQRRSGEE